MVRVASIPLVLVALALSACCSAPPVPAPDAAALPVPDTAAPPAPDTVEPPAPDTAEPPPPDTSDVPAPDKRVVGVDCSKPLEPVMCCQAETPSCIACREEAARMDKNWQATCGPAGFAPPDTTYDCSRPAPVTPCCRALLPKCTECVDRNLRIEAEYRAACPNAKPPAP